MLVTYFLCIYNIFYSKKVQKIKKRITAATIKGSMFIFTFFTFVGHYLVK